MCPFDISDIVVEFDGEDLSKYGLFPRFVWYLRDVIDLPKYFAQISVNRKRNRRRKRRGRKPDYTDVDMCMGLVAVAVLGIPRISQIDDLLKTEPQMARLIGLRKFFDPSTAHRYLNRFAGWHVSQRDTVNTQILLAHGQSPCQDVVLCDIDSQTHTLESRKREGAVVGYNRKKPGKPCLQWNVGFVRGEAVSKAPDARQYSRNFLIAMDLRRCSTEAEKRTIDLALRWWLPFEANTRLRRKTEVMHVYGGSV